MRRLMAVSLAVFSLSVFAAPPEGKGAEKAAKMKEIKTKAEDRKNGKAV